MVLGDDGAIRYANAAAVALLGRGPVEGARLPDLVGDDARPEVAGAVGQMLDRTGPGPGEQTWHIPGPHGQAVYLQVRVSDLRAATPVGGLLLTLRDVTGQLRDEMTGLLGRRLFDDRAEHAVAVARRAGTTLAIVFVDLDDFGNVNTALGHPAGDELLAAAAARLAKVARPSDTIGRRGEHADEFAVILENLRVPADARKFARRVVRAFSAPFDLAAGQVSISVSVGVATSADADTAAGILARADLAMLAVKRAGKGAWRAWDPAMARSPAARAAGTGQMERGDNADPA